MKKILLNITVITVFAGSMLLISCVSQSKFNNARKKCDEQRADLNSKIQSLNNSNMDMTFKIDELNKRINNLNKDTGSLGSSLRDIQNQYNYIKKQNDEIFAEYSKLKSGDLKETQGIMDELQTTKANLQKRENDLNSKEKSLNELSEQLKANQKDLQQLQSVLNRKDSVVKALKKKVTDALLGFENKGLTIQQKNGKVYVSMEETLLFASGSFAVSTRGVEALKKLAKVLEANPDINVLVEGHTDNVPYKGAGQLKDNWDLSVMRATTIVKIIVDNSNVDPKRLTAAGKSEYSPVDVNTTADGRSKNRRTEIILTPKLDELFKIIDTN